jgi:Methyltransferase FkbM domain
MRPMDLKRELKQRFLPDSGPHRLPAGIGRGLRMNIDFEHETRLFLGLYEIELNRHLRTLLRPGVKAFDIGAQAGYDALVIAKHTGAPVASFECDHDCFSRMRSSFALNPGLGELVQPVEAMVGVDLGLDEFAYGSGFVPDFLKVDVDGGEMEVLSSAERLLAERRPPMIVEIHSAELERRCGELMIDRGYRVTIVNQRKFAPDHRPTKELNRWLVAV